MADKSVARLVMGDKMGLNDQIGEMIYTWVERFSDRPIWPRFGEGYMAHIQPVSAQACRDVLGLVAAYDLRDSLRNERVAGMEVLRVDTWDTADEVDLFHIRVRDRVLEVDLVIHEVTEWRAWLRIRPGLLIEKLRTLTDALGGME